MSFFTRMNTKLDEGWKLTDISCTICKGTIMISPAMTEYYCVKCDMPAKILQEQEDDDEKKPESLNTPSTSSTQPPQTRQVEETPYQNPVMTQMNRPDPSKKLGEKLLQGWTMLRESCPDCQTTPLMKSRKGEFLCVACDKNFDSATGEKKEEKKPAQNVQQQQTQAPVSQTQNNSSASKQSNQQSSSNTQASSTKTTQQSTQNSTKPQSGNVSLNSTLFEKNLQNHNAIMDVIGAATLKLGKVIEENAKVDRDTVETLLKLIHAQKEIDNTQIQLLKAQNQ